MSTSAIDELIKIKDDLWRFLEIYAREGKISHEYCKFHWNNDDNNGNLRGNSFGLAYVAYHLLMTASSEADSTHSHLDEHSGMAEGSDPLIVFKESAPWERGQG